jgi:hypothetical protein
VNDVVRDRAQQALDRYSVGDIAGAFELVIVQPRRLSLAVAVAMAEMADDPADVRVMFYQYANDWIEETLYG